MYKNPGGVVGGPNTYKLYITDSELPIPCFAKQASPTLKGTNDLNLSGN